MIEITEGYEIGLISKITEMHIDFYSKYAGFGQKFESIVAQGLAEFTQRLDKPVNNIWVAHQSGKIVGSIAIDGEDFGGNLAHLRWFITHDLVRGKGLGQRLLRKALDFSDLHGFEQTHLWTFAGLDAAKHLYETHGFKCVEAVLAQQWGKEVFEQRFVRLKPSC